MAEHLQTTPQTTPQVTGHLERLQPLLIGNGESALYACHHEPATAGVNLCPIVICPPIGHEYERCHRALRQLAVALSAVGFNVLRFDYSGLGDSQGSSEDAGFATWQADINTATDFFKQRVGASAIAVVGLRLGANLAMQALQDREDVRALCLWSPVLDGSQLLEEWDELQKGFMRSLSYTRQPGRLTEVLGFPLGAGLRSDIEALAPVEAIETGNWTTVCLAGEGNGSNWQSFLRACAGNTRQLVQVDGAGATIWRQEPMEARVPVAVVNNLVQWCVENAHA